MVVGLLGWGVVARLDVSVSHRQALPLPAPAPVRATEATDSQPPYATSFIDGHWLSAPLGRAAGAAHRGERLTMVIRGSALVVWAGSLVSPEQRIVAYDAVLVTGHRVELRPVGVSGQVGRYRWELADDELTLHALPGTDRPEHRHLVTQAFSRA